jgi:hypothetical protein
MEELLEFVQPLLRFSPLELLLGPIYSPLELMISLLQRHRWENAMANTAYVVHHTPGRVRLRIPSRRDDVAFFQDIETRLSQCTSVQQVRSNPATAGVLVRYADEMSLLQELGEIGLPEVQVEFGLPPLEPVGARLVRRLTQVDRGIVSATRGQVDGTGLTLLFLLGASLVQIARGDVFGAAVPLLWYAGQTVNGALLPAPKHLG